MTYNYFETIPIEPPLRTVWLIELFLPRHRRKTFLSVWHGEAKIEDVVAAFKVQYPETKFSVFAIDVGTFLLEQTQHSMMNARGVNESMEVMIHGERVHRSSDA